MDAAGDRSPRIPCTQCGGPLPVRDGSPFERCSHCSATLHLDLGRFVLHGMARRRLGAGDAWSAVLRQLAAVEADAPPAADSIRLEHRPWYLVPTGAGVVPVAAAPDDEGADLTAAGRAAAAADLEDPPDHAADDGSFVAPTLLAEAAAARVPGGQIPGLRLVHLPVHVVRWRHRGESYRAVVDAVEGSVASARLPPPSAARLDRRAGWVLGLATVVFALEAALLPGFNLAAAVVAVTVVVFTFVARRFEAVL